MTGELRVDPPKYPFLKYDHLILRQSKRSLVFSDQRQFGRVLFAQSNVAPSWWAKLPPIARYAKCVTNPYHGANQFDHLGRHRPRSTRSPRNTALRPRSARADHTACAFNGLLPWIPLERNQGVPHRGTSLSGPRCAVDRSSKLISVCSFFDKWRFSTTRQESDWRVKRKCRCYLSPQS